MKAGIGIPMGKASPFAGFSAAQQKRSVSGGGATAVKTATPAAPAAPVAPSPGGATAVSPGGSDIMDLYAAALKRLSTGGMSLEASLADIEEGKRQAIARGQQSLVSGGLGGTTVMSGVPVAAEKSAARARLGARGEAEGKYLTALASYAAFAQRAQEAAAERSAAMDRLRMQIESQELMTTQQLSSREQLAETYHAPAPYIPESERHQRAYTYGASLSPTTPVTMVSGMGPTTQSYAQQFPSIYGEAEEQTPNWMG